MVFPSGILIVLNLVVLSSSRMLKDGMTSLGFPNLHPVIRSKIIIYDTLCILALFQMYIRLWTLNIVDCFDTLFYLR